jgi:hypothetical protein
MVDRDEIEIRMLGVEDGASIARLAELDTTEPPPSPLLGAIVGGRLVAARSLMTGESIADPFRRTAEIRSLLATRAHRRSGGRGRGLLRRLRRPGFVVLRAAFRRRREDRALRAHALRVNGAGAPLVPGTEHTHLIPRGKGF